MWMRRAIFCGLVCGLAVAGVASASAAVVLDGVAGQANVAPSLCRVVVQNAWGVPLAFAYGFVLGNGQFVVTDLGTLAQPGTARAVVRFQDGSEVVAEQFGMADPVSSLAALYRAPGAGARKGLTVVRTLPSAGSSARVARKGWEQGRELTLATGRLVAGPKMTELALRTGASVPRADWAFFRMVGRDTEGLPGTPVLNAAGAVLGTRVDVMSRGVPAPLVVPATALWNALFASKRELKPLTDLPQTAWTVPVRRVEGEPVAAPVFGRLVQRLKDGMVCRPCKGKGRRSNYYGYYGYGSSTCYACGGDGIVCNEAVYESMAAMALEGTRVAWAEGLESRTRKAILAAGLERLKTVSAAGPRFRAAWGRIVAADVAGMGDAFCRGIVLAARVSKTVAGPEGRYTFLDLGPSSAPVAFRATAVDKPTTPGPVGSPAAPGVGTWIVLAGAALGRFSTDGAAAPARTGSVEPAAPKADPGRAAPRSGREGGAALRELLRPAAPARPVYVLPFAWVPTHPAAPVRRLPGEDSSDRGSPGRGSPGRGSPGSGWRGGGPPGR